MEQDKIVLPQGRKMKDILKKSVQCQKRKKKQKKPRAELKLPLGSPPPFGGLSTFLFPPFLTMIFSRLRRNPYTTSILTALSWVPVAIFFVDHGYSYAVISGRSMQVQHKKSNMQMSFSSFSYSQRLIQTPI